MQTLPVPIKTLSSRSVSIKGNRPRLYSVLRTCFRPTSSSFLMETESGGHVTSKLTMLLHMLSSYDFI
uniref:Uncharacterized protein n=1 Tax=Arundo donax TaxID=35708 RepID=A0A0A9HJ83_ARUDO